MWTGFKQIRQTSAWKWMVHLESILRMTLCLIMSDTIMTIIMTVSSLWIIHLPFLRPSSSWLFDRSLSFCETVQSHLFVYALWTVHFESFGPFSLTLMESSLWLKTVHFRLEPIMKWPKLSHFAIFHIVRSMTHFFVVEGKNYLQRQSCNL